jgi:hypothetical protein
MMSPEGTFDYQFTVPDDPRAPVRVWRAASRVRPERGERRLVGHAPYVRLEHVEPRYGVCHTRITFETPLRDSSATAHRFGFSVDRALTNMLHADDIVSVARDWRCALGVSVVRDGRLVAAAGAVTNVPLGPDVLVRRPGDLVAQAEAVFRRIDPGYSMVEWPVEVTIAGQTRIVHGGRFNLGGYEVFVVHGATGKGECMSIALTGVCPDCAASLSAPLLESPD